MKLTSPHSARYTSNKKQKPTQWGGAKHFIGTHWLALILVAVGTWLRVVDLPGKAIIFPDAGRDLLAAATAVRQHTFPLLGIPSSIPRFKQGPLSIWLNMAIFALVGYDMHLYSLVYAVIGIVALIALYETAIVFFNQRVGLIALALFSCSPLAVAHSRMAYHTTPIPLFTIFYWWGLHALLQQKRMGVFWAVLTGWLLFQFELSMFPVLLMIPLLLWHKKIAFPAVWKEILGGTVLGLLPQLLFDFTHRFAQLGGFGVWVLYRSASLVLPGQHTLGNHTLTQLWHSVSTYLPRIWGVDVWWINSILLTALFISLFRIWQVWRQQQTASFGILLGMFALITLGYSVHGAPSEAYYSIYLVLLPLIIAVGTESLGKVVYIFYLTLVLIIGGVNIQTIFRHSFFVSNPQAMSYGPSNEELQQIATTLIATHQPVIPIALGKNAAQFASSFDHINWAIAEVYPHQPTLAVKLLPATSDKAAVILLPITSSPSEEELDSSASNTQDRFTSQTLVWRNSHATPK